MTASNTPHNSPHRKVPSGSRSSVRGLLENMTSLAVLQAATYLLPLITVPYLVRVLGVEKFGLVAFAQAIIQYFVMFTDYGFNLSATREIAAVRHDHERVREIFSTVMTVRVILLIIGFFLLLAVTALIPRLSNERLLFLITYGLVVGNVLFPVWCFQGLEQMKFSTAMTLLARVTFVCLIFIFVRQTEDYLLVPALNAGGMVLGGVVSLYILRSRFQIGYTVPTGRSIVRQMRSSFQYFVATLSSSISATTNTLVIGFALNDHAVGLYAAAEKLFIAMRAAFYPLSVALYPYMASSRNVRLFRKVFGLGMLGAVSLATAVYFGSNLAVDIIFGNGFEQSAPVVRVFAIMVPIAAASILLGYPLLAALGHDKYANFSNSGGTVVHVLLIVAILPIISLQRVAIALLVAEAAVLLVKLYAAHRHRLLEDIRSSRN